MSFKKTADALIFTKGNETLKIEVWGKDSLRVRSTLETDFTKNDWALTEPLKSKGSAVISIDEAKNVATITNGKITASVNHNGVLSFIKDKKVVLHEYYRSYDPDATKESCCTKVINRQYRGIIGGDYKLTVRFDANDD